MWKQPEFWVPALSFVASVLAVSAGVGLAILWLILRG